MIFQWVDHPNLRREDQLLCLLFDLGMATKEQLLTITKWGFRSLDYAFVMARKMERELGEETFLVRTKYLPRQPNKIKTAIYSLTSEGIRYVQAIMELQGDKVKEAPAGQLVHYSGINNILCRSIENFGVMSWQSSYEIADLMIMRWNEKIGGEGLNRRNIIRPDGGMRVGTESSNIDLYVEFDNDTEGPRQIETKFKRYVDLYMSLELNRPIVWVTISEKRKQYLERNWNALKTISYANQDKLPEMVFFVEGDEIPWIKEKLEKK
ncbi:replication-relaxation family protein [Paenibacillus sp. LHD-117]|uniref:replication-relaxation family protein n=1 Tax=Paenibacillus sp. LHD-117 TaxID=3071412 RepID=UPI0027DFD571|nr:replication-relaxation family protein [Paenibacillus sp. LHD-117]MDQ6422635.1 replication-relaxation family protein [Paenibacillus sp. LHD-117]